MLHCHVMLSAKYSAILDVLHPSIFVDQPTKSVEQSNDQKDMHIRFSQV